MTWGEVADPSGSTAPTRTQVAGATVFPGNEGVWYHDGAVVWTSKGDNRVHTLDIADQMYSLVWNGTPPAEVAAGAVATQPLNGVDNITVENGSGDLFVAEDGDNMEVVLISAEGDVVPFARFADEAHAASEVTGPSFNPTGDRLYFSSQRGPSTKSILELLGAGGDTTNGGVTYEVTGPFRGAAMVAETTEGTTPGTTAPSPSETLAAAGSSEGGSQTSSTNTVPIVVGGAVVVAAGVAGALLLRRRGAASTAGGNRRSLRPARLTSHRPGAGRDVLDGVPDRLTRWPNDWW